MAVLRLTNDDVADLFEQVADLLQTQHANPYRVRAYREASRTVRTLRHPVFDLLDGGGRKGLERLPGIGKSLAATIEELAHSGRLRLLERLLGEVSPEDLFTTVPGIGEDLAQRIHRELGIETLEELELAAHDGRLQQVRGFGDRRVRGVRDALATMLGRSTRRRARLIRRSGQLFEEEPMPERPPVELLLEVDARYRRLAAADKLKMIAPRRFNPQKRAWLPIMHLDSHGWFFTALYSNSARAHELGRTDDWVVIYFEREGHEHQATVVTETRGPLRGCRVVRGREAECLPPLAFGG